ncbi:L,D-transpeptidase family protein [Mobilitalea sibirica]|uniref:L,D-transpeptidase family protein n=1 Tax=Mobilitalea sibirica TaxID=1462919 RepID=A0A8J7KVQ4_9FIRM|nr:L,D-transpeptidase family protein [Mobilitalea sibirica]MBH1940420.1 L,D-transpeptidase family protein [Mobilitalea sibirica]
MKQNKKLLEIILSILLFCISLTGCDSNINVISSDQDTVHNKKHLDSTDAYPDQDTPPAEVSSETEEDTVNALEPTGNPNTEINDVTNIDIAQNNEDINLIQKTEIEFEETSEIVYATANVNIRSGCTTKEDNIVALLKKGESLNRVGFHEEWSKVIYQDKTYYISSDYLSLEKPMSTEVVIDVPSSMFPETSETTQSVIGNENSAHEEGSDTDNPKNASADSSSEITSNNDFVSKLNLASEVTQIITVIGNGASDCTVYFHKKDKNGVWKNEFTVDGDIGSMGITYDKREGDKKTPAGLYSFTLAFGLKKDPGAYLPYRQITEYDYWIDDVNSPYYNTWVNSQEMPGEYISEHLIEHDPSYTYALNINYNSDCTPGLGSAMFLHCYNGKGRTTGCIAISEEYMKRLIQQVDEQTRILIVPDFEDLKKY